MAGASADEQFRRLQSSRFFGSGKAVSFIRERVSQERDEAIESPPKPEGLLTGDEVSEFYLGVLSLPEQRQNVPELERTISERVSQKRELRERRTATKAKKSSEKIKTEVNSLQLFQYAQNNDLDSFQSAIRSGKFDVDMQDAFHWTLLMVAAYAGHTPIVHCLLEKGAKWREFTDRGMNAIDLARSRGHADVAKLIENFESGAVSEDCKLDVGIAGPQDSREAKCQTTKRHRGRTFYCKSCRATVTENPKVEHNTSIVHLYCGHHCAAPSRLLSYGIPESNRGFQMMLRSGWNPEGGLGSRRQGKRFPVKTVLKQDRLGFGVEGGGKARVTHFSAHDKEAVRSSRDRHRKVREQPKKLKDILQEKAKDKKWERRMRTIMNHEGSYSHLFT